MGRYSESDAGRSTIRSLPTRSEPIWKFSRNAANKPSMSPARK